MCLSYMALKMRSTKLACVGAARIVSRSVAAPAGGWGRRGGVGRAGHHFFIAHSVAFFVAKGDGSEGGGVQARRTPAVISIPARHVCCNSCNFFAANVCNKKIVKLCNFYFCGKSCKPVTRITAKKVTQFDNFFVHVLRVN